MDLVILGEGSREPELRSLVSELGIGGRVHLPGFSTNPWGHFSKARLFVLPSRVQRGRGRGQGEQGGTEPATTE